MNEKVIEIFAGAKVRDVLLKYSEKAYRAALSGQTIPVDKNNNPVDLDGELSNGQRLYIKVKKKQGEF
jgi:hypothetical protein